VLDDGSTQGCLQAQNKAEYAHEDGGTANVDILLDKSFPKGKEPLPLPLPPCVDMRNNDLSVFSTGLEKIDCKKCVRLTPK
jgi:hypothetical protein